MGLYRFKKIDFCFSKFISIFVYFHFTDHDRTIEGVVTPVVVRHVGNNHDRYHVHIVDHLLEDHLNNQETMKVELVEGDT